MPNVILATAGYDHTIRLWEARTGFCYRTLQFNDSQANQLEITPNKKYLAAAGNPQIKLFELATHNPNPVSHFSAHKSNVTAIGFEKGGDFLYSGSEDGTIKIWDPRLPNFQREFVHSDACNTVVLHPLNQNELIAGYQNGSICVYDQKAGKKRTEMMVGDDTAIRSLTLMADGTRCCAATSKGEMFVWKLSPESSNYFEKVTSWQAHNTYILKALYSPNMNYLATCSADKSVKIWNAQDHSLAKCLTGHTRWVWDCVFSSGTEYLVTASSDNMARLWDIKDEKSVMQYSGHHKAVICVALNDVDNSTDVHKSQPSSSSSSNNSQSLQQNQHHSIQTQQQQKQQHLQNQQLAVQQAQQQRQTQATNNNRATAFRQQFVGAATSRQPQADTSKRGDDTDSDSSDSDSERSPEAE